MYFPSVASVVSAIVERACGLPEPEAAWLDILRRQSDNAWSTPIDPTVKKALRAVGGFMEETVQVLQEYAKIEPNCIRTFKKLKGKETSFGWEEQLVAMLN